MKEVWEKLEFNPLYEISNLGNIRRETKILKQQKTNDGYLCITIKKKHYRVHRLVAMHFIPNPNNLKEVNHINGNKTDNNTNNLEWVNRSNNIKKAYENGLMKGGRKDKRHILIYDQNGNFIGEAISATHAARLLGICPQKESKHIKEVCDKKQKSVKKYRFEWAKTIWDDIGK